MRIVCRMARFLSGQGPALVGAAVAGPDDQLGAVGGAAAVGVEALAGLRVDQRAVRLRRSSSARRRRCRSTAAPGCRPRCRRRRRPCTCRARAACCRCGSTAGWRRPLQVHSWILVPSAELAPLTSTHLPPTPVIGPVPPPPVPCRSVNASTSNSVPVPPVERQVQRGGAGRTADSAVDTSVKVSQPPVTGTATEPSTVPVGEPARTDSVPPEPPEDTRAVNRVSPRRARRAGTRSSRRC